MVNKDRRDFLKRLAKGAVYAAPVVVSMAAPVHLVGQGMGASMMMGMGMGMGMGMPDVVDPFPPPPGRKKTGN